MNCLTSYYYIQLVENLYKSACKYVSIYIYIYIYICVCVRTYTVNPEIFAVHDLNLIWQFVGRGRDRHINIRQHCIQ